MNRFPSFLAYAAPLAVAAVSAVVLMSSPALAETPTIDTTPFVSALSRAEVRADLLARSQLIHGQSEWAMQMNPSQRPMAGLSRAQVKAEYVTARDVVQAINAEDSGSAYFARARVRGTDASTVVAGGGSR